MTLERQNVFAQPSNLPCKFQCPWAFRKSVGIFITDDVYATVLVVKVKISADVLIKSGNSM